MITIFSTFRPFSEARIARIQRNAARSWHQLGPSCELIFFGEEPGVKELADELHARYVPHVERGEKDLPLISSLFARAQELARNRIVCYTNGDIIFTSDFVRGVSQLQRAFPSFVGVGRRWDLVLEESVDFAKPEWEQDLNERTRLDGSLHGPSGIDYFIFPKGQFAALPPFVVGRGGWDNAVLFHARRHAIPLVDMTSQITAIHQEYEEKHSILREVRVSDEGAMRNIALAGGRRNLLTIREVEWVCDKGGIRATPFPRRVFVALSFVYPWRALLGWYRTVKSL